MIAVAVKDYDDQNIIEECETGWRRFCTEVLVRTHYYVCQLSHTHREQGLSAMGRRGRKASENLRRQVAAYRWVFEGTGGDFTFAQTCEDLGLCPVIVRRKLLSQARFRPDINLLVGRVSGYMEATDGHNRRRQDSATRGVGTSIVARVGHLQRDLRKREGRRGSQSHAVCRGQDRYACG